MEKKNSISNKIFFITLVGSFVGSVMVGVWIYILLTNFYDASDAFEKAVISIIVLQILFLIPVYLIKLMIDKLIINRIKKLTELVNEISIGNNLDKAIIAEGDDELAELTEAFERMRISMKTALEQLELEEE
ncbi:MAG: HAMP domain-containing protein [Persephonella sp.]|nr:MAG: HAMP domain-containing protein [Persephonella sp.]RUM61675.1 MAG: HAMP domain-containing protein [Persephonella sp.]